MRLSDPVAVGDLVYWKDPRAPKRGDRLARALDVAGPWVLLRPEFGPRANRSYWVLARHLVLSVPPLDAVQKVKGLLKLAGTLPLEDGDPPLLPTEADGWRNCLVCKQSLHPLRVHGEDEALVKKWLYCGSCDRMQRLP